MPRPKTEALVEVSSWMDQAHQLESALNVLAKRAAAAVGKAKRPKATRRKKGTPPSKSNSGVH